MFQFSQELRKKFSLQTLFKLPFRNGKFFLGRNRCEIEIISKGLKGPSATTKIVFTCAILKTVLS